MVVYEQVYFDNDGLLFFEEFLFPEKKGDVYLVRSRLLKEISDELLSPS